MQKRLALKVVAVAHEKWSLTGGSKYILTWNLSEYLKSNRYEEVIVYEWWSQPEVPL